jgi:hypothetical protein
VPTAAHAGDYGEQQSYRVGAWGRLIYFLLSLVYLPFGSGLVYVWFADSSATLFYRIVGLPFGLAVIYISLYGFVRAFGPGLRFTLGVDGFTYRGIFSVVNVMWDEVERFKISQSRLGTVTMRLHLKQGHWPANPRVLDLCGLRPSFEDLIAQFERHLKSRTPAMQQAAFGGVD